MVVPNIGKTNLVSPFVLPHLLIFTFYCASALIYLGMSILCAMILLSCLISYIEANLQVVFVLKVEKKLELYFCVFTVRDGQTLCAWRLTLKRED